MIARLRDDALFEEEREGQISRSDSSHMCVVKGGKKILVSEARIISERKAGEPDGSKRTSALRARGLLHRGFINRDTRDPKKIK